MFKKGELLDNMNLGGEKLRAGPDAASLLPAER